MEMREKILVSLEHKPLSNEELAAALGRMDDDSDYVRELYLLTQESLIEQKAVSEGCKTCACHVTYKWRLTRDGRKQLNENNNRT